MKRISLLCLLLMSTSVPVAMSETLKVSYLERPPYYFTQQGTAKGLLIELASQIFEDAAIEVSFKPMPPNRIMYEIKNSDGLHCSVGWFKKPEREAFAKFSLPFYRNRPISVLTSKDHVKLFAPYGTLREVFTDNSLIMATVSSFSYGSYIDKLIKEIKPKIHEVPGERRQLAQLIKKGRASYLLTAPEEVEMLVRSAGFERNAFVMIPMKDVPAGNKRHLMCSRSVSDETIERLNRSILRLIDHDMAKN